MSESKEGSKKSWLKSFFGSKATPAPPDESTASTEFGDQFWKSVVRSSPTDFRINKLTQLTKIIESTQIERSVVEKLWIETKDLLNPTHPKTVLNPYFTFLKSLVKTQHRQLGMLKPLLYQDLKDLDFSHQEDILNVMLIINYLTDRGKNLCMMEQEVNF